MPFQPTARDCYVIYGLGVFAAGALPACLAAGTGRHAVRGPGFGRADTSRRTGAREEQH